MDQDLCATPLLPSPTFLGSFIVVGYPVLVAVVPHGLPLPVLYPPRWIGSWFALPTFTLPTPPHSMPFTPTPNTPSDRVWLVRCPIAEHMVGLATALGLTPSPVHLRIPHTTIPFSWFPDGHWLFQRVYSPTLCLVGRWLNFHVDAAALTASDGVVTLHR